MKYTLILLLALSGIACTRAQKTNFAPDALEQQLTALDGSQTAFKDILNQYRGKTIVIEVWASWCGDCIKAMPKLKNLQAEHPEVSYLFLSMDKANDKWKAGIVKHDLKGDHFWATEGMKGAFGKAIDLDWIPRYIIVDKTGKIVTYRAIETDFKQIDATLNTLK